MSVVGVALLAIVCLLSSNVFGQSPDTVRVADTLHLVDTLQPPDSQPVQDNQEVIIVNLGDRVYHPDGILGKPSFNAQFTYASVTGDLKRPVGDIQRLTFGLDLVAASRLTLLSSVRVVVQDSTRYEVNGGIRLYVVNPLAERRTKNPDGPVGGVSLTVVAGARFSSSGNTTSKMVADGILTVPVSTWVTISGGYRYYEEIERFDVQKGFGSISVYPTGYSRDSAYVNPDGSVGNLAFKLSGGGSVNGIFGEIQLLMPFSGNMTVATIIRGERVPGPPYRRSAIAGFRLSYYP